MLPDPAQDRLVRDLMSANATRRDDAVRTACALPVRERVRFLEAALRWFGVLEHRIRVSLIGMGAVMTVGAFALGFALLGPPYNAIVFALTACALGSLFCWGGSRREWYMTPAICRGRGSLTKIVAAGLDPDMLGPGLSVLQSMRTSVVRDRLAADPRVEAELLTSVRDNLERSDSGVLHDLSEDQAKVLHSLCVVDDPTLLTCLLTACGLLADQSSLATALRIADKRGDAMAGLRDAARRTMSREILPALRARRRGLLSVGQTLLLATAMELSPGDADLLIWTLDELAIGGTPEAIWKAESLAAIPPDTPAAARIRDAAERCLAALRARSHAREQARSLLRGAEHMPRQTRSELVRASEHSSSAADDAGGRLRVPDDDILHSAPALLGEPANDDR